jgi:hypothetical protein
MLTLSIFNSTPGASRDVLARFEEMAKSQTYFPILDYSLPYRLVVSALVVLASQAGYQSQR